MRDADVRGAVRCRLAAVHYGDSNTRIVEEMGVWSSSVRIDIAIINGELTGIELKSDRDTLGRLPLQADLYSRVFDRVELVAGARHVQKAMSFVPDWWKITIATMTDGCVELADARPGSANPAPDPYLVAQLLWKNEAIEVLESFGLAVGWRSKRIKLLHERLAAELPFTVLSESVRLALKRRDGWLRKPLGNQGQMALDA